MIVYRISKRKYANDLSGYGSYLYGGRWSEKGQHAVYTACHRSLAYLEFLVHQLDRDSYPGDIVISAIEIRKPSLLKVITAKELPENWKSLEYSPDTQKIAASHFSKNCMGLIVPSVIIPDETNVILNPRALQFETHVQVTGSEFIQLDRRFYGLA